MTKYLGIDYGRAKVGLAVSEAALATPLTTLNNNDQLLAELQKICEQERVETIVCGLPEGELVGEIEQFAHQLAELTQIPVKLHPETLSSQEAVAKLRAAGAKRAKLQNDHVYAAALILEDYLEQNSW